VRRTPDSDSERRALQGAPASGVAGLARRIFLTYKYRGARVLVYRALTFPLRFTPLKPYLLLEPRARVDRSEALRWYRKHGRPVTIVIASYRDAERVAALVRSIRRTTRTRLGLLGPRGPVQIVVADDGSGPEHVVALRRIRGIEVVEGPQNAGFAANVNRGIHAADGGRDVVVLNSDMLARRGWLPCLQYAAYADENVGIVGAKLLYGDGRIQFGGTVRNPEAPEWFDHRFRFKPPGHGPANVTGPVLAVTGACMYIKRDVIDRIGPLDEDYPMAYEDVDFCLRAWQAGYRVVYAPNAELIHLESMTRGTEVGERERASQRHFWRRWSAFFDERNVRTVDGKLRVVYVTEDAGVGGGHRVVYEHINGLIARGHDVELWSLDEPPGWFDLRAPVRTFSDYEQLVAALSPMDAIKVATWWRTAVPVWEASVLRGIPVYFVQDIETSYYPDSARARDEVLASYRHEFRYLTTSSWNRDQLEALGMKSAVISPGVDLDTFGPLFGLRRRADLVLAIGRSNPLKNLPLTLAAWYSLPRPRPQLRLFGIEPELVKDEDGIEYTDAPSDAEVNALLNSATTFVQTSSHEGFCLPVLEAMAAGCPVVCTDAHGNRDFCQHEVNCLMPRDDGRSVREALERVMRDTGLRERLASAGIHTAAQYAWAPRIESLERFFIDIAKPRRIEPSTDAVPDRRPQPA
jgi:GT2 family glycosyltransferase